MEFSNRHSPILSSTITRGEFIPNFTTTTESKSGPIIPFLIYFDSVKPGYSVGITLSSNTSRDYDKFDYVTFTTFKIIFDNGTTQEIIPGNREIPYYGHSTNGRQVWITPTQDEMSSKKFKVCNKGPDCFGWISPISMDGHGSFKVIISGTYSIENGPEEKFYHEMKWNLYRNFRLDTVWNAMGGI